MTKQGRKTSNRKTPATASDKLRVAAYCRVSTESDEQESSLDSQISYYTDRINERPDWICVGIFSDTGTGRNTRARPEFIKLMQLCRKKKVDLVLTKSVSRFGRNSLDVIKAMRKLQALGVDVLFELEGMRLLTDDQSLLEILTAFAQSESKSKSADDPPPNLCTSFKVNKNKIKWCKGVKQNGEKELHG